MYLTVLNKDCLIHLDDNAAFVLSQGIWIISNEALTQGVWSFEGHLVIVLAINLPTKVSVWIMLEIHRQFLRLCFFQTLI